MTRRRGRESKRYRIKYREVPRETDLRQPADWTKNNNHRYWLYYNSARKKQIEAEDQFVKTKDPNFLRKAKIHNYKEKKLLFEGENLYEESLPELGSVYEPLILEVYPEQKGNSRSEERIKENDLN